MSVIHRVCQQHSYPTTRHCAWSHFRGNKRDGGCPKVFYKVWISDRLPMMTDKESTELCYLLCNDHYYEHLEGKKKTGIIVSIHKEKEFASHFQHAQGNCIINALENVSVPNLASTATLGNLSVASLPPTTSPDLSVFPHNVTTSIPYNGSTQHVCHRGI